MLITTFPFSEVITAILTISYSLMFLTNYNYDIN